jgi:hypothetical protein
MEITRATMVAVLCIALRCISATLAKIEDSEWSECPPAREVGKVWEHKEFNIHDSKPLEFRSQGSVWELRVSKDFTNPDTILVSCNTSNLQNYSSKMPRKSAGCTGVSGATRYSASPERSGAIC